MNSFTLRGSPGEVRGGYFWTVTRERLSEPLPDAPVPPGELAERSHVLSILGARGLELPDLQVWGYAEANGLMHELQPG